MTSFAIESNPWSPPSPYLGNISTVLFRNISVASRMQSPTPWRLAGNTSENARLDGFTFQGVTVLGAPLTTRDVVRGGGGGEYATNVTVCTLAADCGESVLPRAARGWTNDQICGRTKQPVVNGDRLPALTRDGFVGEKPYCDGTSTAVQ